MRRLPKPSASQLGLLVWAAGLGALGFVPGFAGPTYPLSIVVGVVLGIVGALSAAGAAARRLRVGEAKLPEVALASGMRASSTLFVVAFGVAMVHGLRVGLCDFGGDTLRWLLGPGAGAVLAGVWGSVVGYLVPDRRLWRWALACGLPIVSYAVSFWRFYTTPMVFAFDHFVGYFAGTLYDTELGSLERLWTYRLASVGFGLCGLWLLHGVSFRGGVRIRSPLSRSAWGAAGALLAGVITARGPELGHYQTLTSIHATLHHTAESPRCLVRFGPGVPEDHARLLAQECTAHVTELEGYFDVSAPAKTTVYLFQSAEQKSWFMGARHVYIAKPWREEIYIQALGFPHPVLRHELAHVVAGGLGRGPFRIAGGLFGLSPDPGRIEGFATAAAPSEEDPLTAWQWAAAMKRLGILPPLGNLFQLGFFGANSSTAYTVAGAFVEWVRETFGVSALKVWYGGGSLEQATRSNPAELERRFVTALDAVALSDHELAAARARFDRPAVLARKCPYKVDAALAQGLGLVVAGECGDAQTILEEVLALDPQALRAELGLGQCAQTNGAFAAARVRYGNVATSAHTNALFRAAALERLGDVAWQSAEHALASEHYSSARELLVEEERLRQLDVKMLALGAQDEQARRAVAAVFFGADGKGALAVSTGLELGRWLEASDAPLAHYLVGKQLWAVGKWGEALVHLRRAGGAAELPPRVVREARRGTLIAACAVGDRNVVRETASWLAADEGFPAGAKVSWQAFAKRCSLAVPAPR